MLTVNGFMQKIHIKINTSFVTFALHSRAKHTDSTGIDRRLHGELGREVWYILATVTNGERVGARVKRDVSDCVGPVSIVLDVDLGFRPAFRDDLNGQLGWTSVCTVHNELPLLPDLGTLQAWARAPDLKNNRKKTSELTSDVVPETIINAFAKPTVFTRY